MQLNEDLIRNVVSQVLAEVGRLPIAASNGHSGRYGVFDSAQQAIVAAREAFEKLSERTIDDRRRVIDHIRRICIDQQVELGTMEMEETKIGRLVHKIEKLNAVGTTTPGVEFLRTDCYSGDHGVAIVEYAPFGVIGVITPVTHSLPTIGSNAIAMIAAGNTLVVNPHPSGKRIAVEGVRRFNKAIYEDIGIDNLICVVAEPTLETAEEIFKHRDVALICVTGGPFVARAALNSGKRAIVAGPGNPPVVVDETADLDHAAQCIVKGGAYDNNLLCISEKEVFVVESVFDAMMESMERAGAVRLNSSEIDRLTSVAIVQVGEGERRHDAPAKELLGKDAAVLARAAGRDVAADTELLFGETDESNPFVSVEQMMPFVPFVRCRHVDEAIAKAKHFEHGFRHTAIIHSRNVETMTRMGRIMDTSLFIQNGHCMTALGVEGEGYGSFSIATPTGEGVTNPLTFTRQRRSSMVGAMHILGSSRP